MLTDRSVPTWPTASRPRRAARPSDIDGLLEAWVSRPSPARGPGRCRAARSSVSPSPGRSRFNPEVLLLDEPTANLDPRNVRLVEDLIRGRQARGVTIVLAVHQIFQARRLADRTALLLDGRIVEVGATHAVLDAPQDPRTRAFLSGDMIYD